MAMTHWPPTCNRSIVKARFHIDIIWETPTSGKLTFFRYVEWSTMLRDQQIQLDIRRLNELQLPLKFSYMLP